VHWEVKRQEREHFEKQSIQKRNLEGSSTAPLSYYFIIFSPASSAASTLLITVDAMMERKILLSPIIHASMMSFNPHLSPSSFSKST